MLESLKFAFVDVETTGARAPYDRVIEIGIQRVEEGRLIETYSTLVDPECRIPPIITQLTGITNAEVVGAPTFAEIARQVYQLLEGCVFVAHNVRFDYGFIRNEFARLEQVFSAPCLCTVRLSRLLYPRERQHNLDCLIERFHIPCEHRHRALDDARVLWTFLQCAREEVGVKRFEQALKALLKRPTLPPHLAPEAIETLPSSPGVYVFYDETGIPLYVGKSVDIRERVLSHFSNDHRSGKEMQIAQHTARIDTHPTYGELGALLLEAHLITTLVPLYNSRARARQRLTAIREGARKNGYQTTIIEELQEIATDVSHTILGVFHSRQQARAYLHELAKEHKLCPKFLGLERSRGTCLARPVVGPRPLAVGPSVVPRGMGGRDVAPPRRGAFDGATGSPARQWRVPGRAARGAPQLRQCSGACVGKESPIRYNLRFATALAARRLKRWPYPGAILIEEHNAQKTQGHAFVIDQWRVVRALAYGEASQTACTAPQEQGDYDTYKMLVAYLSKYGRSVRVLTATESAAWCSDVPEVALIG